MPRHGFGDGAEGIQGLGHGVRGITDAPKGWHASVKALQNRLAAEKVALSTARKSFPLQDQANGGLFLPLLPDPDGTYPPSTPYSSGISQHGVK